MLFFNFVAHQQLYWSYYKFFIWSSFKKILFLLFTERVCDTVYETDSTNRNDFQCIKVRNSVCSNVDQTLYDKTCRTTTKFECNYNNYGYGSGGDAGAGAVAAGYGAVEEPKDYCKRTQSTQCYNTPRVVNNQVCVPQETEVCQTVINTVPIAKEKHVCRNDEKKVCELEQRAQPKQVIVILLIGLASTI